MTDNVLSSFDGRNWRLVPRSTSQYITQTTYLTLVCHTRQIDGRLRSFMSLTVVRYVVSALPVNVSKL